MARTEKTFASVALMLCLLTITAPALRAQAQRAQNVKDIVDIELLTHTEIYDKIHKEGKTSVVIVNGGTEQRGPHDVLGGHTFVGHANAVAIAKALGNALAAPTLPFSPTGVSEAMPGGVSIPNDVFMAVNAAEIESMATNGFKDIFIMGDHGGGQAQLKQVADEEDRKLSAKGVHVYYISDYYQKSDDDFEQYCVDHHIPVTGHAGVSDTSELLYWQPAADVYVRPIYKTVPFDPGPTPQEWKADLERRLNPQAAGQRGAPAAAQPANRVNNGVSSDPHMSSKELGKLLVDITVKNSVAEIKKQMAEKRGQ
jgi:creatinine amidohydrolase